MGGWGLGTFSVEPAPAVIKRRLGARALVTTFRDRRLPRSRLREALIVPPRRARLNCRRCESRHSSARVSRKISRGASGVRYPAVSCAMLRLVLRILSPAQDSCSEAVPSL